MDGMIIIKWIFRRWEESKERIDVAQTKDRWCDFVKAVAENRLASSTGLCSVE